MRLWVRLGVVAALLVGVAVALAHLRTENYRAGNRLHDLYARKRRFEKACWQEHLALAAEKSPPRLRDRAVRLDAWRGPTAPPPPTVPLPRDGPPVMVARRPGAPPP